MKFSDIFGAIRRYYGMPMRRGPMMTRQQIKAAYLYMAIGIVLAVMFTVSLATAQDGQENGFWTAVAWSLVALFTFGVTVFTSVIYGYHHRHDIDTGDEEPVDLSQAYLGGVLAAILAPISRWLFDYSGVD